MAYCCKIPSCRRKDSKAMFSFPGKNSPALTNWKLACRIPEDQPIPASHKVCFQHFPSGNVEARLKVEYTLKEKDGKFNYKSRFHGKTQLL